jgi:uncharacterized protein (TIGR03067 family)
MNTRILWPLALAGLLLTALLQVAALSAQQDKPEKDKAAKDAKDKDAKDKDKAAKDKDAKDKDAKDKDKKDKGDKKDEPTSSDPLKGDWKVVKAEEGGEAQKDFKDAVFTFSGDKLKVAVDKDVLEYTYKVEEGKTPRAIQLRDPTEPKKGPALGIFEVTGDKLKLCVAPPEASAPTAFESGKPKVWLFELERKIKAEK